MVVRTFSLPTTSPNASPSSGDVRGFHAAGALNIMGLASQQAPSCTTHLFNARSSSP
jgi:hypothetical protein